MYHLILARVVAQSHLSSRALRGEAEGLKPLSQQPQKWFLFGSAGGTVVVHVSLTTLARVGFRLQAVISGFLRVLRSPVVILDLRGVALTGPLGRTGQVTDRLIQYK